MPTCEVKNQPLSQREKLELVTFLHNALNLVLTVLDGPFHLIRNLEVLGPEVFSIYDALLHNLIKHYLQYVLIDGIPLNDALKILLCMEDVSLVRG
jgi:hypothetical protein